MDVEYVNDIFPIFLIKNDDDKICEFKINFQKPFHFKRKMECALLDLNLPNKLSTAIKKNI